MTILHYIPSIDEASGGVGASSFTFFIYLFHEPTLNIVRKLLIFPLGTSSLGFAINYLISPWVFAMLFIGLGWLLRKYMPKVYGVCVGGR